jgi:hypothetical protein
MFGNRAPLVVTSLSQIDVLITNGEPAGRCPGPEILAGVRVISV